MCSPGPGISSLSIFHPQLIRIGLVSGKSRAGGGGPEECLLMAGALGLAAPLSSAEPLGGYGATDRVPGPRHVTRIYPTIIHTPVHLPTGTSGVPPCAGPARRTRTEKPSAPMGSQAETRA